MQYPPPLRAAELFAGVGGLAHAVAEGFGAETAWTSEVEPGPARVLARRWPAAPNHGDVTRLDFAAVEPVDVMAGGSPCQDVSTAGRRRGMHAGTRSGLWESMREGIAIQRPRYVVWENVRGAFTAAAASASDEAADRAPRLRAIGRVIGDLSELGYDGEWRGLRAADVGAPHERFRVFVVAWRRGTAAADPAVSPFALWNAAGDYFADPADLFGAEQPHTGPWPTSGAFRRGALFARPAWSHVTRTHPLFPTPRVSDTNGAGRHGEGGPDLRTVVAEEFGGQHTTGSWGRFAPAIEQWQDVTGHRAPLPVEPGTRRLAAGFVEWLVGLEPGHLTDTLDRRDALRAAGNIVVPQQAAAAIRSALEQIHPAARPSHMDTPAVSV